MQGGYFVAPYIPQVSVQQAPAESLELHQRVRFRYDASGSAVFLARRSMQTLT
jgi:hypothetical protein